MAHTIRVKIPKAIEMQNSDVVVVIRVDGEKPGTLTINLGSIDWSPSRVHGFGKSHHRRLSCWHRGG
jgi:hypothetical protein